MGDESTDPFAGRMERVRAAMAASGIDVLLLSVGADLPWLCGYEAMPLERLTMLVVPVDSEATLVVPALEAPRVVERGDLFTLRPWSEAEDPVALVARASKGAEHVAVGDRTWARFVLALQGELGPAVRWDTAHRVTGPLRAVKDAHEVAALRRAADAADRAMAELQRGSVPLVGRTEAEVSADLGRLFVAEGHQRVNFAIVAAGANAASPHHEPGERVIAPGEVVLCDVGGTMADPHGVGYCSDITRCVWTGEIPPDVERVYAALHAAQQQAVAAATVGTSAAAVDAVARDAIAAAGWGERFVHRTGHGIGVEEHEDPYLVTGNEVPLMAGNAFSIEPGIYVEGDFGFRLEDIVVATDDGPEALNRIDHRLLPVDA